MKDIFYKKRRRRKLFQDAVVQHVEAQEYLLASNSPALLIPALTVFVCARFRWRLQPD